jgi:tRNA threonylcarbamoyl adenosine modification protein YeaZ
MNRHSSAGALCGTVLVVEAATSAGSVALLHRDAAVLPWQLLARSTVVMGSGREDRLTPAVAALCESAGVPLASLSAVVCGSGPGSFTSLRIAGALVKGLACGLNVPLFAIPSLLLVAAPGPGAGAVPGPVLVLLDALREECFAQRVVVAADGMARLDGGLRRVSRGEVADMAADARLLEIDLTRGVTPDAASARWCAPWESFGPQPVDDWEPEYGRLAEAQVKWEAMHGRPLPVP